MTNTLSLLGLSSDTNATDSITIELRETTTPFNSVVQQSGILFTNGTSFFEMPAAGILGNSYYLVVHTRNGIETWSKLPVTIGLNTVYDFTH